MSRKSPVWKKETNQKRSEAAKRRWANPEYRKKRRQDLLTLWDSRGVTPQEAFRTTKVRTCRHCKQEFQAQGSRRWCMTCCPTLEAFARLRAYGMSQPEFDEMFNAQGGLCLLCDVPISMGTGRGGLHHDHNHSTGKMRGLLCGYCNRRLGVLEFDLVWLARAQAYINEHR